MARKLLIDATHSEETRVVLVNGNKVEEFDFDTSSSGLITGNIYLAKISRIEPSLQAAFVDYGGNRHGFLAFSEIHPDYFQIPQADREALLQEEMEIHEAEAIEDEAFDDEETQIQETRSKSRTRKRGRTKSIAASQDTDAIIVQEAMENPIVDRDTTESAPSENEISTSDNQESHKNQDSQNADTQSASNSEANIEGSDSDSAEEILSETYSESANSEAEPEDRLTQEPTADYGKTQAEHVENENHDDETEADGDLDDEAAVQVIENDDEDANSVRRPSHKKRTYRIRPHNRYKIQEVVKVRQVLLVQVVREERGNKGAALTTYLSLPGRYCVLMPNTARGGGISRKIANNQDRKRLKSVAKELMVPKGAGLIVRTAGAKQSGDEIKRDYDFLTRQWNKIRELTLASTAPEQIYAESGPIRRAIRDLLTSDCNEVLIEGKEAFKEASDYMNILMPERINSVKLYNDTMPLFSRYQVESYLNSMFNPIVQLKSGGYLVIGITEALIAIDVNSGRSTKQASIEETALCTNLEAAEEVARQLKLRDLAGLIVIDFIDMEQRRHQQQVENRLKDALSKDRARIQVGRISTFGLLEMSRQRLRTGLVEAITTPCPHCAGTGIQRSDDNLALSVIRAIEEEISRGRSNQIIAKVPVNIANYLFNEKRDYMLSFASTHGVEVKIEANATLISPDFTLEKNHIKGLPLPKKQTPIDAKATNDDDKSKKKRRSRGGRSKNRNRDANAQVNASQNSADSLKIVNADDSGSESETLSSSDFSKPIEAGSPNRTQSQEKPEETKRPTRKPRTRKTGAKPEDAVETKTSDETQEKPKRKPRRTKQNAETETASTEVNVEPSASSELASDTESKPEKPKRKPRTRKTGAKPEDAVETKTSDETQEKPKRKPRRTKQNAETETASTEVNVEPSASSELASDTESKPEKPKRKPRTRKESENSDVVTSEKVEEKPKRKPRAKKSETSAVTQTAQKAETAKSSEEDVSNYTEAKTESKPKEDTKKSAKKKGWWSL